MAGCYDMTLGGYCFGHETPSWVSMSFWPLNRDLGSSLRLFPPAETALRCVHTSLKHGRIPLSIAVVLFINVPLYWAYVCISVCS